jgi:hypothetical protein
MSFQFPVSSFQFPEKDRNNIGRAVPHLATSGAWCRTWQRRKACGTEGLSDN